MRTGEAGRSSFHNRKRKGFLATFFSVIFFPFFCPCPELKVPLWPDGTSSRLMADAPGGQVRRREGGVNERAGLLVEEARRECLRAASSVQRWVFKVILWKQNAKINK